jgi:hypothetical protein
MMMMMVMMPHIHDPHDKLILPCHHHSPALLPFRPLIPIAAHSPKARLSLSCDDVTSVADAHGGLAGGARQRQRNGRNGRHCHPLTRCCLSVANARGGLAGGPRFGAGQRQRDGRNGRRPPQPPGNRLLRRLPANRGQTCLSCCASPSSSTHPPPPPHHRRYHHHHPAPSLVTDSSPGPAPGAPPPPPAPQRPSGEGGGAGRQRDKPRPGVSSNRQRPPTPHPLRPALLHVSPTPCPLLRPHINSRDTKAPVSIRSGTARRPAEPRSHGVRISLSLTSSDAVPPPLCPPPSEDPLTVGNGNGPTASWASTPDSTVAAPLLTATTSCCHTLQPPPTAYTPFGQASGVLALTASSPPDAAMTVVINASYHGPWFQEGGCAARPPNASATLVISPLVLNPRLATNGKANKKSLTVEYEERPIMNHLFIWSLRVKQHECC